ncbi:MAG: hypothetical protein FJ405_03885, partial [Verrucomicrobia bacterium]|nr:hypothetical protein [Verrucomicrobiota bacterium]
MKYLRHCSSLVCFLLLSLQAALGAAPSTVAEAIQQIRSVDSHGKGHTQAVMASRFLATQDAGLLDDLLIAMDGANPLAANWLRASVETIASRSLKAGQPLPTASLGEFLLDVRHAPSARQLAFDLLSQSPSNAVQSLLPGMLHDPSMPLRRSAVQGVLEQAMQLQTNGQSGA